MVTTILILNCMCIGLGLGVIAAVVYLLVHG